MPIWLNGQWWPDTSAINTGNAWYSTTTTWTNTIWINPIVTTTAATTVNYITWTDNGTGNIPMGLGVQSYPVWQQQASAAQQAAQQRAAIQQAHLIRNQTPEQVAYNAFLIAERRVERAFHAIPKPAHDRAFELLLANLTDEQKAMYREHGFFIVEGGKSKQKYRIRANGGISANIDVMDGRSHSIVKHRLCAHCDVTIPPGDHFLAQKLMLESDEDAFLRIANRHG